MGLATLHCSPWTCSVQIKANEAIPLMAHFWCHFSIHSWKLQPRVCFCSPQISSANSSIPCVISTFQIKPAKSGVCPLQQNTKWHKLLSPQIAIPPASWYLWSWTKDTFLSSAQGSFDNVWTHFWLSQLGWEAREIWVLLASSEQQPWRLLNVPKCTVQLPTTSNYAIQNVLSAQIKKPLPSRAFGWKTFQ